MDVWCENEAILCGTATKLGIEYVITFSAVVERLKWCSHIIKKGLRRRFKDV